MKFSATLRDVVYSDPQEFAAAVKAQPPLKVTSSNGRSPVKVQLASLPAQPRVFAKPTATLTAAEKEWLGASVRRSDGLEGQVWCLGQPKRNGSAGTLWVAADGKLIEVEIASLDVFAP